MNTLLVSLVAIAALDSLNPTATALQIYLLSTPKPVARSATFIFGVFAAYWTAGLLFALGLSRVITKILNSADSFIYVIQFIIGILLIIVGWRIEQFSNKDTTNKRPKLLKPIHTFVLGAAVTFWEAPTAMPYLAAIERIIRAKLNFPELIGILLFYNLIFVLPLIVLLGIYIVLKEKSVVLLNKISQQVTKWFSKIMRVLLVAFGVLLVVDCLAYSLNRLLP